MPEGVRGALPAPAMIELLRAARNGSSEVLGALADDPVVIVDLGERGVPDCLPRWLPCVVVGVAGDADGPWDHLVASAVGCDVVLASGVPGVLPRPFVAVTDLSNVVGQLARRIRAHPEASVMLAQVLRATPTGDLGAALWDESVAYSALQGGAERAAWLSRRGCERAHDARDDPVRVDRRGPELWITLHRPHVRNAIDASLRDGVCAALAQAAADPSVTAVHLQGAGPDFCSGGDVTEFVDAPDPVTGHFVRTVRSMTRALAAVDDRATAHLHGWCIGAGIEVAAAAGRVEAAGDALIQLPEVAMGLIPGAGGTATIPRRIGRHRTAWLGLSGEVVGAATAAAWGLVDEIVPH